MPFVPLFEEVAESEIIGKMMAVIHRDMKDALDHWYLSDALPDFAVMTEGGQDEFTYPLLTLTVEAGSSDEANGEFVEQELIVAASMAVSALTVKTVIANAKKYVRCLRSVLRAGVVELLPDADQYTNYEISFRHQYLHYESKGEVFTQPVEMLVRLKFGET